MFSYSLKPLQTFHDPPDIDQLGGQMASLASLDYLPAK